MVGEKIVRNMTYMRTTPGTHLFKEDNQPGEYVAFRSIYITKDVLPEGAKRITVTVEVIE